MVKHEQIERAAQAIRQGKIVVFPTETVYCLGADLYNQSAIAKIFEVKKRPKYDPLIVHISAVEQLDSLVAAVPEKAKALIERFWPGGLTVMLPKKDTYHDIVTAGMIGVSVRLPSNEIARELIRLAQTPVAVAAANIFGNVSPTTAQHVRDDLGDAVEIILDDGPCVIGIETTIVSFLEDEPIKLRPGAIALEEIERVIGPVRRSVPPGYTSFFPGMSDHHYTRRNVMMFLDQVKHFPKDISIGLLSFKPMKDTNDFSAVEVLSPVGDHQEAAHNLFSALRRLDAANIDLIVAQRLPEEGIGIAINDRLARACY
jgi:L-threonylcarbamoyladenylate synthase